MLKRLTYIPPETRLKSFALEKTFLMSSIESVDGASINDFNFYDLTEE